MCRARRDGRNLYCKSCVREKVATNRRAIKEYKMVRKQHQKKIEEQLRKEFSIPSFVKLSPVDRVRNAIRRSFHTQVEIGQETKLGKDEIGDAIANLLLWTKEIRTAIVDNQRLYFIREVQPVEEKPIRKECVLSLSCLGPVIKGVGKVA
jgi:hypothetical protein